MKDKKLGERRARTMAVASRRHHKLCKAWLLHSGPETKASAMKEQRKRLPIGKFKKWNGNCNDPRCHPKYNRAEEKRGRRKDGHY